MSVRRSLPIVERRLLACLREYKLGGASVLVAFSGGADSTALLRAAKAVSGILRLGVYASWVDHGIRPVEERAGERSFVESLTARLGVPCAVTEAPSEPLAVRSRRLGSSLEAEARDFRYRGLVEAARGFGCDRILTAHTKDDQTETILLRVLSGSGTAGLRGIPRDRSPFLRPFLSLSKRELLSYLESLGQDWREDSTNEAGDYRRNRLRRDILPRLEEAVPGFRSSLASVSEKSRLDESYLKAAAGKALPVRRTERESSFPAAAFWRAHPALRLRALTAEAGRLAGRGVRVPYALVRPAALASRSREAGFQQPADRILAEGAGLRFVASEDAVRVVLLRGAYAGEGPDPGGKGAGDVTSRGGFEFSFEQPGIRRIDTGGSCRIYFRKGGPGPVQGTFDFPVLVRSRRPGDRLEIRDGTKSVDDLLAELSVPRELRDFVPVLEDRRGVFAVLGSALGGRDRYRHHPEDLDLSRPVLCVELTGFEPFFLKTMKGAPERNEFQQR